MYNYDLLLVKGLKIIITKDKKIILNPLTIKEKEKFLKVFETTQQIIFKDMNLVYACSEKNLAEKRFISLLKLDKGFKYKDKNVLGCIFTRYGETKIFLNKDLYSITAEKKDSIITNYGKGDVKALYDNVFKIKSITKQLGVETNFVQNYVTLPVFLNYAELIVTTPNPKLHDALKKKIITDIDEKSEDLSLENLNFIGFLDNFDFSITILQTLIYALTTGVGEWNEKSEITLNSAPDELINKIFENRVFLEDKELNEKIISFLFL